MNDTIAAQSTAPGVALRAVVRMSGPRAFSIARELVARGPDPGRIGGFSAPKVRIALEGGCQAMSRMLVMRAPRSYTTEDVVEFHVAGAQPLAEAVLKQCLEKGARPAEPGEFTKRAYLGGRLDGSQVEGILSLIESRTEEERKASIHLLRGGATREAARVRRDLVEVLASLEAYLDFTDDDTESVNRDDLRRKLEGCLQRLRRIEGQVSRRVPFRNLPRVVLLGPPNAGKSSLFRALVPGGRALISGEPGTTRDLLEGEVKWKDRRFLLYDAPGVHESTDPLDRLALSQLECMMPGMEAALIVADGSGEPPREEIAASTRMAGTLGKLFLLNKSDLASHEGWREYFFETSPLHISSHPAAGLDVMLDRLCSVLPPPAGEGAAGLDAYTIRTVQSAESAIGEALEEDWEGGIELVAMELREATDAIGRLAGRVTDEEVLHRVFSRFCIGK